MKKIILPAFALLVCTLVHAQTWNGSVSTNWNTAGNWTGGLPGAGSNVTIPGSVVSSNWPVLNSNVTINGITTSPGCQLNVNGFTLTINGVAFYTLFNGVTINNSNPGTDIVLNLNTGGGGYAAYFRSNTVNDHIIFNLTGTNSFQEGDAGSSNQYNGNVNFNIAGSLPVYISQISASQYGVNLTVNRTVAGLTSMFNAGASIIGNYSYTNNVGGQTGLGNNANKTNITGTINMSCNYPSPETFDMYNITNQTTGGTVNIQNSRGVFLQKDTLKVASLSVTGYRGAAYGYVFNNSITGNITFADDATYGGGYATYFKNNLFTGATSISNNGTNTLFDADAANTGNHYIGNTTFNCGGGTVLISHADTSRFDGNLSIIRTRPGHTQAFNSGGILNGNFSYVNDTTGASYFGNLSVRTSISGTVNIAVNNKSIPDAFEMRRIINLTTGGIISVQNSRGFILERDTLYLNSVSFIGYRGTQYGYLLRNSIVGNVTTADDASYAGGYATHIRGNVITGNTSFTNNGTNIFWDADGAADANTYNGNVSYTGNSTSGLYIAQAAPMQCSGNVIINRTVAGHTQAFNSGSTISGNFSYTNNAAGNTYLGNVASKTGIGGTINITANYASPGFFEMRRLINQTTGGVISVLNSAGFELLRDTLQVASVSVTGYRGSAYGYLFNNQITGNVNTADDASYTGGYSTVLRSNIITGNASFSNNGTNSFTDADGALFGNIYNGNVSFMGGGTGGMFIAHTAPMQCTGNVTVSRTTPGTTYVFNSGSSVVGNFLYSNNTAGNTYLGNNAFKTSIGGSVNIAASYTTPNVFEIRRIVNQTGGGSIRVSNSSGFDVIRDTLIVDSLKITGYRGNNFGYFTESHITGNVSTSDDVTFGGGYATYFRKNTIVGNTSISCNGSNVMNDADGAADINKYIGNVSYSRTGGTLNVAIGDTIEISGNLTINTASGFNINNVKFNLETDGTIEQLGTQPISLFLLMMEKTGSGKITFNDSVTVRNNANFTSGLIYSSAGNELIFTAGSGHTNASATSHVIGPVSKIGSTAFIFPVGGPISLNTVGISAPVGATSKFKAEYKHQNPSIDGFNTSVKAGSFGAAAISNAGYWDVQRLSGATNVTLTLGFGTNPYETYPTPLSSLKVAHWNGAQWDDHGNGGTTGTAAGGTVINSVPITSFSPFAIAGVAPSYFFSFGQPGPGPDGSPIKLKGVGGYPAYTVKQLPGGAYTSDSIFLVPNGSTTSFRLKDFYGVEKDTTITAPASPVNYASANGNGTINLTGWRHFVYMRDGGNNMMGAIKDNNLTLGNTTMNTYFSTANVTTSPNGNIYLKRSFKITSQFAPVGIKRVRFYISKTEFNNLVAADPASFPDGINSLTITKYTGPMEDSLFSPQPGGNAVIIPNSAITIADLGTMYSLDIDVDGFSGFYIGGNNMNLNLCSGSTITLPSNISGATYQWQVDNGGGFANITNGGIYSGATTGSLTITNPPNTIYGYKYRALVNGVTPSQEYTIKLNISWTGAVSTAWENVANWSCGALPTDNSDVIINAGKPNFPQLNSNATIRTLRVNPGATVTVKTGFNLTIKK